MSERGVFAVDRGIWTDADFPNEPFTEREAWLWLVGEAAWRETKTRVGSIAVELQRGQCAFSTRFMAAKFQWSEARVRRFLKRRSDLGQLSTKTDAGATQITICKYDAFQRVGLPSDAPATQERRTSDAKKKQGNIQTEPTEANASSGSDPKKRATRVDGYQPDIAAAVEIGLTADKARLEAEKFLDFWRGKPGQSGVKVDWPATWRNWARGALQRDGPGLRVVPGRAPPTRQSSVNQHIQDQLQGLGNEHEPRQRPRHSEDFFGSTIEAEFVRSAARGH